MDETIPMFLKANVKNQGYIFIWSNKLMANVDQEILDKALPMFDSSLDEPCIAYTGTLLAEKQFLLVVGGYWKNGKDEYGRQGLQFWCGTMVHESRSSHEALWQLSDTLLSLLQRFETDYEKLGDILADLAQKEQEIDWASRIFKLLRESPTSMDEFGKRVVLSFLENKKPLSARVNLQVRFPFHPNVAAPCMLSMLLFQSDIQKIGGGNLSINKSKDIQILSTRDNTKNYAAVLLNDLIQVQQVFKDQIKNNDILMNVSLRRILLSSISILFILALCVALFVAIRQFVG